MEQNGIDKKRIIKNTFLLYGRMVLTLLINLYCGRVVLQALGVVDYGVYNVVAGVVVLFTFVSNPLYASTSRFLTFEIGTQNAKRLNQVLSVSMLIYLGLGLLVCLLTETLGLWFVKYVLVIPPERLSAAIWILHFSAISIFFSLLRSPFSADVISHERMDVFAIVSLIEVLLRLIIVLCLVHVGHDKLITYAFLMSLLPILSCMAYWHFCHANFEEARGQRQYDSGVAKELLSFMGWSLTGGVTGICNGQGMNMLLNVFFGPTVNAARGIAIQVQSALNSFSSNIQKAINPQITITYASNRLDDMHRLVAAGAKYTYLFLFIISLPIFCFAPYVLTLWLGEYPSYTVEFIRMTLILNLIDAQTVSLVIANHATGDIKKFQIWVELVNVATLPLAYLYLRFVSPENPLTVYYILLLITLAAQCVRIAIVLPNIKMSLSYYIHKVITPLVCFSALMIAVAYGCVTVISLPDLYQFLVVSGMLLVAGCILAFFVALSHSEKSYVISFCHRRPFGQRL